MSRARSSSLVWGLAVVIVLAGAPGVSYAYEWFTWAGNGHSYAVIDVPASVATQAAAAELEGAYLVTITSWEESVFLYLAFGANAENFWTGGYRDAEGWKWMTGEPFDFVNWDWEPGPSTRNNLYFRSADATVANALGTTALKAIIEREVTSDSTPPVMSMRLLTPAQIRPPHNQTALITVTGSVWDEDSGVGEAWLELVDEYGECSMTVPVHEYLMPDGSFTVSFGVDSKPAPRDKDGRSFELTLWAADQVGNAAEPLGLTVLGARGANGIK